MDMANWGMVLSEGGGIRQVLNLRKGHIVRIVRNFTQNREEFVEIRTATEQRRSTFVNRILPITILRKEN